MDLSVGSFEGLLASEKKKSPAKMWRITIRQVASEVVLRGEEAGGVM